MYHSDRLYLVLNNFNEPLKLFEMKKVFFFFLCSTLFFISCINKSEESKAKDSIASTNLKETEFKNDLPDGAAFKTAGVGVCIFDMNQDQILDILCSSPEGVKYFEGTEKNTFVDHGIILESNAQMRTAGVGIAVADIDKNNIPDIIISSPGGIRIFYNPIQRKNLDSFVQ
jgi:hypothetical protein